jgi:sec-independent protein translocase protein TatA
MFGDIGIEKLLLILLVVLLFFGARRIPELAGSMGKGIREFKRNLADPERGAGKAGVASETPADRVGSGNDLAAPVARDEPQPEPKRLLR